MSEASNNLQGKIFSAMVMEKAMKDKNQQLINE